MEPERRLALLRLAGGASVIGGIFLVALLTGNVPSPTEVRDWGESLGPTAPFLAVPLFVGLNFLITWPILAGASGLLFGTAAGTVVSISGVTIAAVAQMASVRMLAGRGGDRVLPERTRAVQRMIERRGTVAVLYSRFIPILPYGVVSYGAGLTQLRYSQMAIGTLVGGAPKVFAYTALGGSLNDLTSPEAIVAVSLMIVLALAGLVTVRRQLREERAGEA